MLKKFYEKAVAGEAVLAATLLVLMVLLIFMGGVMRMLGHPINWSTDFATAFFAWACFLCADIAWRRNTLMSIQFVTARLPAAAQKTVRLANYAVISAFLAYLAVMGAWLSWTSRVRSFQGIPEISYSWVTMSASVGGLLLLLTTALKVRDEFMSRSPEKAGARDLL